MPEANVIDVKALYNEARMNAVPKEGSPSISVIDDFLKRDFLGQAELETLASHLTSCISSDTYPFRNAAYPLLDLEAIVLLKTRVFRPNDTLSAIYHLIDDYLLPKDKQKYRFTLRDIGVVLHNVTILGLEQKFDITYIERAIEKAKEEGYLSMAVAWEKIKGRIENAQRTNK